MTALRLHDLFDLQDAVFSATEAACYSHTFLTVANLVFLRLYSLANGRVYQPDLTFFHFFPRGPLSFSYFTIFFSFLFSPIQEMEGREGKGKRKTLATLVTGEGAV